MGDAAELEMFRKKVGVGNEQEPMDSAPPPPVRTFVPRPSTAARGATQQASKVKMLKIVTFEKNAWGKLAERALYVFGEEDIARYERHKQQAAQAAERVRTWLATGDPSFP